MVYLVYFYIFLYIILLYIYTVIQKNKKYISRRAWVAFALGVCSEWQTVRQNASKTENASSAEHALQKQKNASKQAEWNRSTRQARYRIGGFLPASETEAAGFLVAGYFGPINPRRTRRNGVVTARTAEHGKE